MTAITFGLLKNLCDQDPVSSVKSEIHIVSLFVAIPIWERSTAVVVYVNQPLQNLHNKPAKKVQHCLIIRWKCKHGVCFDFGIGRLTKNLNHKNPIIIVTTGAGDVSQKTPDKVPQN